jgi:DnaJ-class molecular chaperone
MTRWIECPYCNGTGEFDEDDLIGSGSHYIRNCFECNGTGQIPDDEYENAGE